MLICKSTKPLEGVGVIIILFNSSIIRSLLTIFILEALRFKASNVASSILKRNCVANRTHRIIRNGSSLKVMSGSNGVLKMPSAKSCFPPKGSINSPKRDFFKQIAIALIVKSRRFWSSSKVPSSTIGFRESCE